MTTWYDRDGSPVPLDKLATIEWGARDPLGRKTDVKTPWRPFRRRSSYHVSTVFLSLDHNVGGEGPPLVYETMVFGEGPWDQYCERYPTDEAAALGHGRIVARITAGQNP